MNNDQMPLIVSHYTVHTGYEMEVRNLIQSLERLHLEFEIDAIPSYGSWRLNSNHCAKLVRMKMIKHPTKNILRVDADAVFHQSPVLFVDPTFDADVAAHVHDFRWHRNELLGGTIFFHNIPEVVRLVTDWERLSCVERHQERNPDLLQQLIQSGNYQIQFRSLPDTYCKIFDLMRSVQNPVIEHFQASRRFKAQVNAKVVVR